jgi:hypothetical protein
MRSKKELYKVILASYIKLSKEGHYEEGAKVRIKFLEKMIEIN